ncbi:hypothetical protein DMUE_5592 [Dictyocoela muelleri]|nr:hypothetical protein DMUE_5592 [Dictyocoela muelleri]
MNHENNNDNFFNTLIPILEYSTGDIIEYFRLKGVLIRHVQCSYCFVVMSEFKCAKIKYGVVFKCNNKNCIKFKTTKSIKKLTRACRITNISLKEIFIRIYCFSKEKKIIEVIDEYCPKKNTIMKFLKNL